MLTVCRTAWKQSLEKARQAAVAQGRASTETEQACQPPAQKRSRQSYAEPEINVGAVPMAAVAQGRAFPLAAISVTAPIPAMVVHTGGAVLVPNATPSH